MVGELYDQKNKNTMGTVILLDRNFRRFEAKNDLLASAHRLLGVRLRFARHVYLETAAARAVVFPFAHRLLYGIKQCLFRLPEIQSPINADFVFIDWAVSLLNRMASKPQKSRFSVKTEEAAFDYGRNNCSN